MAAYNILEARNNLSKLIASVESGAEVTITRRGVPVARIVPVDHGRPRATGADIIEWLAAHPVQPEHRRSSDEIESSIRELREAGA